MAAEDEDVENLAIANRWCDSKGDGWSIIEQSGRGGTAPVFVVSSPRGELALKVYDAKFSAGDMGDESEKRLNAQLELGEHDCPYLVKILDGGRFEDRLFLLMNSAPGQELAKRLADIPRSKIRTIVDQVTKACIFLRNRGLVIMTLNRRMYLLVMTIKLRLFWICQLLGISMIL